MATIYALWNKDSTSTKNTVMLLSKKLKPREIIPYSTGNTRSFVRLSTTFLDIFYSGEPIPRETILRNRSTGLPIPSTSQYSNYNLFYLKGVVEKTNSNPRGFYMPPYSELFEKHLNTIFPGNRISDPEIDIQTWRTDDIRIGLYEDWCPKLTFDFYTEGYQFDVNINIMTMVDQAIEMRNWLGHSGNKIRLYLFNAGSRRILSSRDIRIPLEAANEIRLLLKKQFAQIKIKRKEVVFINPLPPPVNSGEQNVGIYIFDTAWSPLPDLIAELTEWKRLSSLAASGELQHDAAI